MSDENKDRRAWGVIARMHAELQRQSIIGGLARAENFPDKLGNVQIAGRLDLASLAEVTERALRELFGDAS